MNEYIAYCGLDGEACEARMATINKDDALGKKVAEEWSKLNGVEITPDMIACTGCRIPGIKTPYCDSLCPIRQCAKIKQIETCADCAEMKKCEKVGAIHRNNPNALRNLRGYSLITLRERPALMEKAAQWFHEKWGVPKQAYLDCMSAYLNRETEYGWFLCLGGERIVGGLGIIENDFHDRKDLTPNVCAVYTEEACRGQGIAGRLTCMAVADMKAKGVSPLYLATDHVGFYERYGWKFCCLAHEEGTGKMTRVYMHG